MSLSSCSDLSCSPLPRSPGITLGDFIKTRKSKKSRAAGAQEREEDGSSGRRALLDRRNLLRATRENIDFSVNDIEFETVVSAEREEQAELRWGENDVEFRLDQRPGCNVTNCLQNDLTFRAVNSYKLGSSPGEIEDRGAGQGAEQLDTSSSSYFSYERVEDDACYPTDEGYYGTTYYYYTEEVSGKDLGVERAEENSRKQLGAPTVEIDEELNNLVLSIIDDDEG